MLKSYIKKVIFLALNDVKSEIGDLKCKFNKISNKVEDINDKVFIEEKPEPTNTFFTFTTSWFSMKPQSLEQRVKDLEFQLNALQKFLKIKVDFVSTEEWKVKKLSQKKK